MRSMRILVLHCKQCLSLNYNHLDLEKNLIVVLSLVRKENCTAVVNENKGHCLINDSCGAAEWS